MTDLRSADGGTRRVIVLSAAFTIFLVLCELVFLDRGDQLQSLARIYWRDGFLTALVTAAASLFSVAVAFLFAVVSFSAKGPLKPLCFILFAFVAAIEFSVHSAFGIFSTPHLAEIAFWAADWRIIRDAGEMYFNPAVLLPITAFGVGLALAETRAISLRALLAMCGVAIPFFVLTTYFSSNTFPTVSVSAAFRTIVGFPTIWILGTSQLNPKNLYYFAERELVASRASTPATNNVVFIMDESIRGDYLSVNGYHKPTTPTLEHLNASGMMLNWGVAASGTTCSATSNNLVLTGLTQLPDRSFDIFRMPTIFQFARAMNYRTYLIDAQASSIWLGKPSDFRYVNEWIRSSDLIGNSSARYLADAAAARRIDEITRNSTGNFIWVNKFGVHRPYSASVPAAAEISILDQERKLNSPETPSEIVKQAYEQGIHYNSESFFATLFEAGPDANTYYVYTSDHGQTLGEGGVRASHCVAHEGAANVPLLMIATRERLPNGDTKFRATHANIFPTLLDLLGVPEAELKHRYALSLLRAGHSDSTRRYFFSGDIHRDEGYYAFDP